MEEGPNQKVTKIFNVIKELPLRYSKHWNSLPNQEGILRTADSTLLKHYLYSQADWQCHLFLNHGKPRI